MGEYIVQGTVTPDNFEVDKESMQIASKTINNKNIELIRLPGGGVEQRDVPEDVAKSPCLTDEEIIELAGYAKQIEKHYGCYMDMEWSRDQDDKLWLVQARPETVWSQRKKEGGAKEATDAKAPSSNKEVMVKGLPASPGVASGIVHVIDDPKDIGDFKEGEIQMQIPCIVGTASRGTFATRLLKPGQEVTVDAKNGVVYQGVANEVVKPKKAETAPMAAAEYFPPTATRVMMNLGDPDLAEKYATLPADGIGLMREEFLWTTYIHQHPLYLIETGHPERVVN